MIAALARASIVLKDSQYLNTAIELQRVLDSLFHDGLGDNVRKNCWSGIPDPEGGI